MRPFWYLPLENGILHSTVFYVTRITNIGFIHLGSLVTIPGFIDQPSLTTCDNPTAGAILLQKWHHCSCKSFEYNTITIATQMGLVSRKLLRQYKQTTLYEFSWKKTPNLQHGHCIQVVRALTSFSASSHVIPNFLPSWAQPHLTWSIPLILLWQLQALWTNLPQNLLPYLDTALPAESYLSF